MLDSYSLWVNIAGFVLAAAVIGFAGTRLARIADIIADKTGLGEAITGSVFLGLITALPGLAASIFAALDGRPVLAISNAIGGIALQTTFLAAADLAYKKANLEHAAASATNIVQTAILVVLLSLIVLGMASPPVTIGHVHPATILLFVAAGLSFWMAFRTARRPMWQPRETGDTVVDTPDASNTEESLARLIVKFVLLALAITAAGMLVADTTGTLADRTGMGEAVAGALLSGLATSLPELVTTIASVRRGALTLAVSDIVGGNFFDALFVAAADLAYFGGSLYHAEGVGGPQIFLTVLAILLNMVFLLGLLFRQRSGPGNIGLEGVLMFVLYIAGFCILAFVPWS